MNINKNIKDSTRIFLKSLAFSIGAISLFTIGFFLAQLIFG